MSEEGEYVNGAPESADEHRCQYEYRRIPQPKGNRCGLPQWGGAPEVDPRCEFHSAKQPADILSRLEAAVDAKRALDEMESGALVGPARPMIGA